MEASKNGAKLVAFPEVYVPGYPHWLQLDSPERSFPFFKKLFEESVVIPSRATDGLCRGAKEADVYVVVGVNEKLSTQMGTMWNTNLIIDHKGNIVGKHRKVVPTFVEKVVWACGDGSGLRVWETDLGRIGTLICGNNTHCLLKYALIAQGEQIHVANYPAARPVGADFRIWNRIRSGANSMEGKVFTITSTSTVNAEMIDMLSQNDEGKRKFMESVNSYSSIIHPLGYTLTEVEDKDEIIYADIDISEIITAKQYHDIVGNYTRTDVVSLNLCQDEDRTVRYTRRSDESIMTGMAELDVWDQLNEIQQNYKTMMEELKSLSQSIRELKNREGK